MQNKLPAKFWQPRYYLDKFPGIWQFVKFAVVGVSNTVVDWLVFFLISHFIFTQDSVETYIKAVAFLVAMSNSYLWNTLWTFKKDYANALSGVESLSAKKGSIFLKFALVSLIGWLINVGVFEVVRFRLSASQLISLIAASAAATLVNFFANKFWTYRVKKKNITSE